MARNAFFNLFVDVLRDAFDAENQIVVALPEAIKAASNAELKEALVQHLDETKNQVARLKTIFKTINESPTGKKCAAMQSLIDGCKEVMNKDLPHAIKDAGLIIALQKIEHYEISQYGSLRTIARHLNDANVDDRINFDEMADLLQAILDEESDADEKLTEVAEGGFFTSGINDEAEKEATEIEKKSNRTF